MHLVSRAHPSSALTRAREAHEVIVLALFRGELDPVVVVLAIRYREDRVEHVVTELVSDTTLQHLARETVAHAVLDHVVEDPGDHGVIVLAISREDDGHVRGMREVGKPRSLAHLLVVVLGRERERVIDAIRIAGARHDGAVSGGTSNARIGNLAPAHGIRQDARFTRDAPATTRT